MHANASVNLDFVQTNVTIYCYRSWKLSTLNSSKADGIPVWLLKENADLLAGPVSEILNSSFLKSRLPTSWKEAVVLGSQNKVPSMILTSTSVRFPSRLSCPNLLKTIVLRNTLNQLCYKKATLDSSELFPNHLLHMLWSTWCTDGNGATAKVVLLDIRKAFDLIDHCVLVQKLTTYDIPSQVKSWIVEVLMEWKQSVKLAQDCHSERRPSGNKIRPLVISCHD